MEHFTSTTAACQEKTIFVESKLQADLHKHEVNLLVHETLGLNFSLFGVYAVF